MIPIFSNTLGKEELEMVAKVFESRWLGQGVHCAAFEQEFAAYLNTERVLLTNCCTASLYIALRALGISDGDEVILSTMNFVACASAVIDAGAIPVYADVDERTLNILPSEIARLRTERTKAVILLHYGGYPAPMDEIRNAADGLLIIEDSANSIASRYKGQACGTLGDAGTWSFDAMKMLVMGDGGALWLKDEEAHEMAKGYRYLGLAPKTTSGMDSAGEKKSRWWEYDMATTSGRFISNDVLASIGRIQLAKLPGFIERRKEIWDIYQKELEDITVISRPPELPEDCTSSYYLYWIQLARRDDLAKYLYNHDVYTTFRYFPLHKVKYLGANCRLMNAEAVANMGLNLPLHQNLTNEQAYRITWLVRRFANHGGWLYD